MRTRNQMLAVEAVTRIAAKGPGKDVYLSQLRKAPVQGHFTHSDLIDADAWCRSAGLINLHQERFTLSPQIAVLKEGWERRLGILDHLWSKEPPPWLFAGDAEQVRSLVPMEDEQLLSWTEADAADLETFLAGLGRKVELARAAASGSGAEEFVKKAYEQELGRRGGGSCTRVKPVSDQLGYDLLVQTAAGKLRIEVKAAIGRHVFRIFLSRNEADAARRLRDWRLVICASSREGSGLSIQGHLLPEDIEGRLPSDGQKSTAWETCRMVFSPHELRPHLPVL